MAEPNIQPYLDDITSQHRPRPKFMARLTAFLEKIDAIYGILRDTPDLFSVDRAEGAQLDVLAALTGVSRNVPASALPPGTTALTDAQFRQLVRLASVRNQWDGTNAGLREIWDTSMGTWYQATYIDNQDMTVDVAIDGDIDNTIKFMLINGGILPCPMGVGMTVTINEVASVRAYLAAAVIGEDISETLSA